MSLAPGIRLGPYEVVAPLGAGGMGEVWRARDTKLDREVALKFLPESFAREPERLARFQREAKVLASLNHTSIAAIYGFHEYDGYLFLAMELVPGEDLAVLLKKGSVPFSEAVDFARQIAEALEVAHEHGVVHRDLKPANIKLTPDGKVKVLDFGLAKALDPTAASGPGRDATMSPTITSLGTVAGVILGTAAYMSPEQARGRSVDKRADIWAFGCVLFEMLTGKIAFAGETISDTMAAVLTREPVWSALPPSVPARVRDLMERCLRKDPKDRLRDIGDARIELADPARWGPSPAPRPVAARSRLLPLAAAIAVVAALVAGAWFGRRSAHTEPPAFRPLTFGRGTVHSARFAPDEQTVIYGAAYEGRPLALFSTRIDGFESRPIDVPSADIAGMSKDGQMALLLGRHYEGSWLRVGTLAQVALAGGAPREILENVYDADISPDGKEFAVVVTDGDDQVLQYPIGKEIARSHGWIGQPRIAPDGKRIVYVDHRVWADDLGEIKIAGADGKIALVAPERQYTQGVCWSPDGRDVWFTHGDEIRGGVLSRVSPGDTPRVVLRSPTFLRLQDVSKDGHVLLLSDETRATVAGELAGDTSERVYSFWDNDQVAGISQDGSLFVGSNASVVQNGEYAVFFRRRDAPPVQLGMGLGAGLTPDGKFAFLANLTGSHATLTVQPIGPGPSRTIDFGGLMLEITPHQRVSCSSDGRRIAFVLAKPGGGSAMYVMDLDGGPPRKVSPEGAAGGIISPDGTRVMVSDRKRGFYVVSAAGSEPVTIEGVPRSDTPLAWSPDGRSILSSDRTLPPRIYRTEIVGGRRELVRELVSADPAGIVYGWLIMSPDGRFYLGRFRRMLTTVVYVTLG
jgi:Tol biopolymer transport system component